MLLYKYRGLKEFLYFIDIIIRQRLYAAPYSGLNDPMEGSYSLDGLDWEKRDLIREQMDKLRICSLSMTPSDGLMWSHYADGHQGVAIGVEIDEKKYPVIPTQYDGCPTIDLSITSSAAAREILSHKLKAWAYEKEMRVFTEGEQYIRVDVRELLVGQRISTDNIRLIKELIKRINSGIEIKQANITYE